MFCSNYSSPERRKVRQRCYYMLESGILVTFLDVNHLILRDDPNCAYKDVYHMLEQKYGWVRVGSLLDGYLAVYLDRTQGRATIVHGALSIVGDSRSFIPWIYRVRCGLAEAILQNVVRILEGRQVLDSARDGFQNIINGTLASMTAALGYHANGFQFVCYFKDGVTPETDNPLVDNALRKLASSSALVSRYLREQAKQEETQRPVDKRLPLEYRAIISQAQAGEVEEMYRKLVQRSDLDNHLARFKETLLGHVVNNDDALHAELLCLYKADRDNPGNEGAWKIDTEETQSNNQVLAEFVPRHEQTDSQDPTPFWVPFKEGVTLLEQIPDSEYSVLNVLTYEGWRSRCRNKRLDNTDAVIADKYTHLTANLVQPKQSKNGYVLVELQLRKKRRRTLEQQQAEYDAFLPEHRPQGTTPGRRFWVKTDVDVTELYDDDFADGDDATNNNTLFPRGYKIFNAYVFKSLGTKYKRAAKKNEETFTAARIKLPKEKGSGFDTHMGYVLAELQPRKMAGKRKRVV